MPVAVMSAAAVLSVAFAPTGAAQEPPPSAEASLSFVSASEYADRFGSARLSEEIQTVPEGARVEGASYDSSPAQPGPAWNQAVRWTFIDRDGFDAPVREGNAELGYVHYSGRHNLFSDRPIAAAVQDQLPVQPPEGARREYQSILTDQFGTQYARIRVINWDNFVTNDGRYVANDGRPIGTISAFCENVPNNRCPDEVNQ